MSYHNSSTNLNLHGEQSGTSSEHMYFSRITQQWEPVWFYASMLKKLTSFAQAMDRRAPSSRELVWSHIFALYNQPNRKCSDLFTPIIDDWCHSQSIDLSAIEIMYSSFLQVYNQYPALLDDLPPSSSSSSSAIADHPVSYSGIFSPDGKSLDFKKDDPKPKPIKLSNTSLLWGNSFASSIQHFSLLLNWAPLLEKLPPNQKEAIWNTCQFFPLFTEAFDRSSFRKTFMKWASNLPAHLSHITILFAAIGFLRDKGIIKHQFFYPNSTVPVFSNGTKPQTPPTSQYPSSPQHHAQHFSPASPQSPNTPSRASSPTSSRSPSPVPHDYQTPQPLHHFYQSMPSNSPHPVLPTPDGPRNPKSLPFESLSLPPLSLPPTSTSNSAPAGTSSSRLGLLALAAFQVDDPDAPAQASSSIPFPPLKPIPSTQEANPLHSVKTEPDVKMESAAAADTPTPAPTASATKDKVKSDPTPTPNMMKISKRKNSCSDFHEDDAKRPRSMTLSHILCS